MFQTRNRLLQLLPMSDRELLAPHMHRRQFRRGENVAQPGDTPEHVYFLEGGMASIFSSIDGRYVETCSVGHEGALNLLAVMGSGRLFARCVMQADGEASCLDAGAWLDAARRSDAFVQLSGRYAQAAWTHALKLGACNSRHTVQQRFARKLLACRALLESDSIPMTQTFMADVLGVQRTTVVAVASQLQSLRIIEYRHGRIHIHRASDLATFSCKCFQEIGEQYRRIYLDIPPERIASP